MTLSWLSPRLTILTTLMLAGLTLISCSGERPNDPVVATEDTLTLALEDIVRLSITPAVSGFSEQADNLKTSAETFCANTSSADLTNLQAAWRATYEQWMRFSNHNYGPLNDDLVFPLFTFIDSLRLRGTNYTSTVRLEISSDIAGTHILEMDYFASKNFQKVGLLALELAIFETADQGSSLNSNILQEYQTTTRKCEVLLGLSSLLQQQASSLERSWTDDYQSSGSAYQDLLINDELEDGTAAITQVIVGAQENLDYMQKRKIISVAAQVSEHAWQGAEAAITHINELLSGTNDSRISLFDIMKGTGNAIAVATVQANLSNLLQNIGDRNQVAFENNLSLLDGNFKREIPDSLDIELGINFSDGD